MRCGSSPRSGGPRRSGAVRRARARGPRHDRPRRTGAARGRPAPAPLRGGARLRSPAEPGADASRGFPLYQALHRFLPFFAMIRNPEKLLLVTSVAHGRPGGARRPGRPGGACARGAGPRRVVTVGALVALVLVATPPWHGIAFARFGDSPVYETLRREADARPLSPGLARRQRPFRALPLRGHADAGPHDERLLARSCRGATSTTSSNPLEAMNVGRSRTRWRRRRSAGWASPTSSSTARASRRRSRPTRPAFTIERLAASGPSRSSSRRDPLWLFRVTGRRARLDPADVARRGVLRGGAAEPRDGATVVTPRRPPAAACRRPPAGGSPGFLTFGPYRPLPAGAYVARFRVRGDGLRLDVASRPGRRSPRRARGRSRAGVGRRASCRSWWTMPGRSSSGSRGTDGGRPPSTGCSWSAADRPESSATYEVEALPHRLGSGRIPRPPAAGQPTPTPAKASGGSCSSGPVRAVSRGPLPAGPAAPRRRGRPGPARAALGHGAGGTDPGDARGGGGAEVPPGAYREVTLDFSARSAPSARVPRRVPRRRRRLLRSRHGHCPGRPPRSGAAAGAGGLELKLHELEAEGRVRLAHPDLDGARAQRLERRARRRALRPR